MILMKDSWILLLLLLYFFFGLLVIIPEEVPYFFKKRVRMFVALLKSSLIKYYSR